MTRDTLPRARPQGDSARVVQIETAFRDILELGSRGPSDASAPRRAAERVSGAPTGQRDAVLYREGRRLGGLVAEGELPPELAFLGLAAGAERAGLPPAEVGTTLRA